MKIDWLNIKSAEQLLKQADLLIGGKADNFSIKDLADRHNVTEHFIKEQIIKGLKIEKEHTGDQEMALEIVKDHLVESPYYYIELKKMEKSF